LVEHQMPLDSLAKLLGHNNLQTTQRYIDGADPAVRNDFLAAMQQLSQQSQKPLESPQRSHFPASPSVAQTEQRPEPATLVLIYPTGCKNNSGSIRSAGRCAGQPIGSKPNSIFTSAAYAGSVAGW
jgi:hypothetical protein